MSLVVFPFKEEDVGVVGANLETAARHHRVEEVWAVAAAADEAMGTVEEIAATVDAAPVRVFPQERIGRYRPGKGDGLNTALRRAATAGFERVHIYDADITNFANEWIDGAEDAADRGYHIVRHRFPRAATDAMITWMVTRPVLAMLFPGTALPRLGQPLGGEMLLSGEAVERLTGDPRVAERSDWGIDTMLTYASITLGLPFYEHHLAQGKRHALYGSLDEIRTMLVECFDAVGSLRGLPAPGTDFASDPPADVPQDLKDTVAYDLERTVALLDTGWTDEEETLAGGLPGALAAEVLRNRDEPWFVFMDSGAWGEILGHLLDHFVLGVPAWESLVFRLWVMRVLAYTTEEATKGYDHAITYLEGTIRGYEGAADQDGSS
jgi:mannosylglycerate synthase